MYIEVNDRKIWVEICGEGRPLILLHGNGEDHTIFDKAAEVLKQEYTCVLPDTRGHGKSDPCAVLHYADMADDVVKMMEILDLRDVCLYGFSDGGIVGLLASMRTDRITDLVVSGANLTPKGVKLFLRIIMKVMYSLKKDPKIRLMLEEPQITDEDLSVIKARTLVLAGSKDLVRETETRQIAEGIPGAELRILNGEGHGSYIVHSEKIAQILRQFLSTQKTG
ncbi:MAG: alpha/beta hydrolase [Solobacterium sp.]|nr:alpha/beta hydrolase [Solobacterium sp.]